MSSGAPLKKITRLRTYKDDMALARSKQPRPVEILPVTPLPTVEPIQSIVQKKVPIEHGIVQEQKIQVTGVIHQNLVEQKEEKKDPLLVVVPAKQESLEHKPVLRKNNHVVHAIETEIKKVAIAHKTSILSDSENVYDGTSDSSEGTIIKDTKRKRFRLLPAMWQALKEGFYNDIEKYKQRHTQQTIAKAETRIDVLNKAVQNSERAPRTDFKEIAEHLRNLERKPIEHTLSFKPKEAVPLPTWSSVLDITEKTVEKVVSLSTPIEIGVIENVQETTKEQAKDVLPIIVPEEKPTIIAQSVVPEALEKELVEKITPKVVEVPLMREGALLQPILPKEKPIVPVSLQTKTKRVYASPAISYKTTAFPTYALIAVVLLASILGVTVTYYFFTFKNTPQAVESYTVPSTVRAEKNNSFVLPATTREFSIAIQKSISDGTGVTQAYPTVALSTGGERPATTAEILAVLQLHAPASFVRSIKEITFGGNGVETPFIIIKGTNFDTLFAGILEWEKKIQSDFSPLFGTSRIIVPFTDALASNKNIRTLQNVEGDDVIVYTFIDQNTILITTKREVLGLILPLVK